MCFQKEKQLSYLQKQNADLLRCLQNEKVNLWELEGHIKKVRTLNFNRIM